MHGVGDHKSCEHFAGDDLFCEGDEQVSAFGVECGGVLVKKKKFRTQPSGHEKSQGLALAPGKAANGIFEAVFEAHCYATGFGAHSCQPGRLEAPAQATT